MRARVSPGRQGMRSDGCYLYDTAQAKNTAQHTLRLFCCCRNRTAAVTGPLTVCKAGYGGCDGTAQAEDPS